MRKLGSPTRSVRRMTAASAGLVLVIGVCVAAAPTASADVYLEYRVVNYESGLCLDIVSGKALQEGCSDSNAWFFPPAAAAGYTMVEDLSDDCLGIEGASTAQGAPAVITSCAATANRQWLMDSFTDANGITVYEVISRNSDLCLTDDNGSKSAGGEINQSTCTGDGATLWELQIV
jgi:Ricin-type beta-trefoil lectin domain-like